MTSYVKWPNFARVVAISLSKNQHLQVSVETIPERGQTGRLVEKNLS